MKSPKIGYNISFCRQLFAYNLPTESLFAVNDKISARGMSCNFLVALNEKFLPPNGVSLRSFHNRYEIQALENSAANLIIKLKQFVHILVKRNQTLYEN